MDGEASLSPSVSPALQVRRAWVILAGAFLSFAALVVGLVAGGTWVYHHATTPESAALEVVSGSGALVRSPADPDWRLVTAATRVREGDRLSTALGTVVRLTMFDGSTVEVAEDTIVEISRMRSSRFLDRTKLIVLRPEQGMVYMNMAERGDYAVSEITVEAGEARVTMSDEQGRADAGAFLVEVIDDAGVGVSHPVRVAVLSGGATVRTRVTEQRLSHNQQTVVGADGWIGSITPSKRELLVNGTFPHGLAGWVEFQQNVDQATARTPIGSSIELVREPAPAGNMVAVEFLRSGTHPNVVQTGIRQRVGKTLRVYSSLHLQFDAWISDQDPAGGGEDLSQFPLVVKLNYIDVTGQEREWSHGYYVIGHPDRQVPIDRGTRLERGRWQHMAVDLRNLNPTPKQITSIVVYASGKRYQTRIANLSLTSSELNRTDR